MEGLGVFLKPGKWLETGLGGPFGVPFEDVSDARA